MILWNLKCLNAAVPGACLKATRGHLSGLVHRICQHRDACYCQSPFTSFIGEEVIIGKMTYVLTTINTTASNKFSAREEHARMPVMHAPTVLSENNRVLVIV